MRCLVLATEGFWAKPSRRSLEAGTGRLGSGGHPSLGRCDDGGVIVSTVAVHSMTQQLQVDAESIGP